MKVTKNISLNVEIFFSFSNLYCLSLVKFCFTLLMLIFHIVLRLLWSTFVKGTFSHNKISKQNCHLYMKTRLFSFFNEFSEFFWNDKSWQKQILKCQTFFLFIFIFIACHQSNFVSPRRYKYCRISDIYCLSAIINDRTVPYYIWFTILYYCI
jgi:hypothetical protein